MARVVRGRGRGKWKRAPATSLVRSLTPQDSSSPSSSFGWLCHSHVSCLRLVELLVHDELTHALTERDTETGYIHEEKKNRRRLRQRRAAGTNYCGLSPPSTPNIYIYQYTYILAAFSLSLDSVRNVDSESRAFPSFLYLPRAAHRLR